MQAATKARIQNMSSEGTNTAFSEALCSDVRTRASNTAVSKSYVRLRQKQSSCLNALQNPNTNSICCQGASKRDNGKKAQLCRSLQADFSLHGLASRNLNQMELFCMTVCLGMSQAELQTEDLKESFKKNQKLLGIIKAAQAAQD